jgi:hypothetical protein
MFRTAFEHISEFSAGQLVDSKREIDDSLGIASEIVKHRDFDSCDVNSISSKQF